MMMILDLNHIYDSIQCFAFSINNNCYLDYFSKLHKYMYYNIPQRKKLVEQRANAENV